jgi:hypothetical protein
MMKTKLLFRLLTALSFLLAVLPVQAAQAASEKSAAPADLLQFTSGGHALGFAAGSMYAATGSHSLHVDFVDAKSVQPKTDSPASSDGKATPLSRVTYADLWAGITLNYTADAGSIYTTTYTLAPGANPGDIRLAYNAPPTLNNDGTLSIAFETGAMTENAPMAWQDINNQRVPVDVSFRVSGQEVTFALGAYNPRYALTIDPSLTWNTFLGGSGDDRGYGIAVDGSGNVYVAGLSSSTWGSPVRAHSNGIDAFVAKLDSSGALTWNTFLGGDGWEEGYGIAVDGSGNVYVTGESYATWGSPVRAYAGNLDGFAAKLDSTGSLVWNTFLGGSGSDTGNGIAVDGSGNAYVTGFSNATWGTPVAGREYTSGNDAYAAKLNSSGGLTWNAFLGGSGSDSGAGIAVDGSGNVYVAGYSYAAWGSPVRAYTNGNDTFAAKLDSAGSLTWHTFLGGNGTDSGAGIAVDGSGNVYVTGTSGATWGSPLRAYTGGNDAFAAKLNSSGALTWNSFLGGVGYDISFGIAVDGSGNASVVGVSGTAWGSPTRAFSGGADAFDARFTASGALAGTTFLGGSGNDYSYGIAMDGSGNVYVTGLSDATWGSPVRAYTSSYDAPVSKLGLDEYALTVNITGNGTVTPSPSGPYHYGDVVDLTPDPDDGWTFSEWGGACTGFGACSVTMDGDKTVSATFIVIPPACYTLTLSHTGSGDDPTATPENSSGCPSGQYHADESISLLASPADDWIVDSWSGTDNNSSTSTSNTLTMPAGDHAVTVNYVATPPPGVFGKTAPTNGSYAFTNPTLTWGASSGADGYEYCYDTTNNNACDTSWISTGSSTSIGLSGLTNNRTYYWHVRATNSAGTTYADGGAWWSFTARNQTFADVPIDHTLWQYIEAFYNAGITTGCGVSPLIYCPENSVTRASMAVFLLRAKYGSSYTPPAVRHFFSDLPVAGKEWQEAWVDQFYSEGITGGCGAGPLIYCPENPVTRAAMAVFILRTKYGSSYTPPAASHFFADMPVAGKEWMEPWVDELYREGITTGCGTGPLIYCPETAVKRQAMAAFIVRAFNLPLP